MTFKDIKVPCLSEKEIIWWKSAVQKSLIVYICLRQVSCINTVFVFFNISECVFVSLSVRAVAPPVAGQTSDFVNKILENTGHGDPTGGLVGLRVPTSKI